MKSKAIFGVIKEMFGLIGKTQDEAIIGTWARFLDSKGFTIAEVKQMANNTVSEPNLRPFDLTVGRFMASLNKKPDDQLYWDKIIDHIGRHGSNSKIDLPPHAMSALRLIGDLPAIGLAYDVGRVRKEFLDACANFMTSEHEQIQAPKEPGNPVAIENPEAKERLNSLIKKAGSWQ